MDKIASFTIDHERLLRGVYVSRLDKTPTGDTITTYDIRMTEPNRQKPLLPEALHAIEHLAATYLRNHPKYKSQVVYWGPMGCCTGNYLILQGEPSIKNVVALMIETMDFIKDFSGPIPGATSRDCGNYSFMNLNEAKKAAEEYSEILKNIKKENMEYPK